MNKLIVLSGVPGSGKSYISLLIKDRMKAGHVYAVSSDALRKQICGTQQCLDHDDLMWAMYYEMAKAYALDKDGIVILDSTNSRRMYRIDKVKPIKHLFDEVDLVTFELDKLTVMRQNMERDFPIPSDALERLIDEYEHVNEEDKEFFDNIFTIDDSYLNTVIDKIIK